MKKIILVIGSNSFAGSNFIDFLLKVTLVVCISCSSHLLFRYLNKDDNILRWMIYRYFGLQHPAQKLSDKMVDLKTNRNGTLSAKIDYSKVIDDVTIKSKPISTNIKDELKDLNDTACFFEPDGNLDD